MRSIPFHLHDLGEEEVRAVTRVLRSHWINAGPETAAFEKDLSRFCKAKHVVALNSATSGLFLCLKAFGIGPGDEVITTPLTFVASASVILQCGAKPVFADIGPDLNLSAAQVEKKITRRTKAVIAVDYGGVPSDYEALRIVIKKSRRIFSPSNAIQKKMGKILLIADCAHSIGSADGRRRTGTLADFSVFSFHAVKNITTSDGGAISFNDDAFPDAARLEAWFRSLSQHGRVISAYELTRKKSPAYDIAEAGWKFNTNDILSALGRVQLGRYQQMARERKKIADLYEQAFKDDARLSRRAYDRKRYHNSWHLYTLLLKEGGSRKRDQVIALMKGRGIGLNIHYRPVPDMTAYRNLGYTMKDLPMACDVYGRIFSLPIYSKLGLTNAKIIIRNLREVLTHL